MGDESIEASGAFPDNPDYGLSNQSFMDELRTEQQSLRTLGEDTGGYAAVNMNDFTKAWDRVVADSSNYYVLGYYPTNDRRDGRYRKIEVRVKGDRPRRPLQEGLHGAQGQGPRAHADADRAEGVARGPRSHQQSGAAAGSSSEGVCGAVQRSGARTRRSRLASKRPEATWRSRRRTASS